MARGKELNQGDPDTWVALMWKLIELSQKGLVLPANIDESIFWSEVYLAMQWIEEDVSL